METPHPSLPPAADHYDLARFIEAQAAVFGAAFDELARGRKRGHWMWFVFPQAEGLGRSALSQHFAIRSAGEARAYAAHPLLGRRLRECAELLDDLPGHDAVAVFGSIDALKLRSSLTLFEAAGIGGPVSHVLERWFGNRDPRTLAIWAGWTRDPH